MQEPKFKGFDVEDKIWRYGFGWYKEDYTDEYKKLKGISEDIAMLLSIQGFYKCSLRSMGLFTGAKDLKGKEIWDGDLVETPFSDVGVVYYDEESAMFRVDDTTGSLPDLAYLLEEGVTVIGNKYEQAERMKGFE